MNNVHTLIRSLVEITEETLNNRKFIPGKSEVPVSSPKLSGDDVEALLYTVMQLWYTDKFQCHDFRTKLQVESGKKHAILTNSGSSASLIAITAMAQLNGLPSRKVITCATGFPTTVSPILQNGMIPVYIDIDPKTLSPRMDQLEEAMQLCTYDLAGIVLAHNLGFVFDEKFVADAVGWHVCDPLFIADCCDALGSKIGEREVGCWSDMHTYSFFPAHQIMTAEGGAVMTNGDALKDVLDSLCNWGRSCYCSPGEQNTCGKRFEQNIDSLPKAWDHKYTFDLLGYNLKMTEFQAALGLSQMNRLRSFTIERRRNFDELLSMLSCYGEYLQFVDIAEGTTPSPFGFPILVKENAPFTRHELVAFLEAHKVRTRPVFAGNILRQPAFRDQPSIRMGLLEGSDNVMENMFWIGVAPVITLQMLSYVAEVFHEFMAQGW